MPQGLTFGGVHFFVRDMPATLAFYRRLGLIVSGESRHHAVAVLPGGEHLEFGTYELTRGYDPGWRPPEGGYRNALQFSLPSRDAVDDLYEDLTGAGYTGHLPPFDAFWGARYAEVEDPDGNLVGFHSPQDPARRSDAPPL